MAETDDLQIQRNGPLTVMGNFDFFNGIGLMMGKNASELQYFTSGIQAGAFSGMVSFARHIKGDIMVSMTSSPEAMTSIQKTISLWLFFIWVPLFQSVSNRNGYLQLEGLLRFYLEGISRIQISVLFPVQKPFHMEAIRAWFKRGPGSL